MIYLYVKTHNKTGLKYLGKTIAKDPHKYKGSGRVWKDHCSKYGYDYTTDVLFESEDKETIAQKGRYYSTLWNVVESKEWANLKPEECDGGFCANSITAEANAKRSASLKGRTFTAEHRKKLSEANKGKYWHSDETKQAAAKKASLKLKGKKKPEGFGEKIRQANLGKTMSSESRDKMKSAWTAERKAAQSKRAQQQNAARLVLTCPHCGKQGTSPGNMKRYHYANCKSFK